MIRVVAHGGWVVLLTLLTQLGGLAWLLALFTKWRWLSFVVIYAVVSVGAVFVAPLAGRVALPCIGEGPLKMQSPLYCALNRHYVTPEMASVLEDAAAQMASTHPDTVTLALDGNFPFWEGFPLLPHLSHDDGEKADLAFYYQRSGRYEPGLTRSPIGYFAFEDGPTDCPQVWLSLRWDLGWVQPLWPRYDLDRERLRAMMALLAQDPRVGKIFLEPHLVASLGLSDPKIRFQGCRAARHDDHIHLQL